MSGEKSLSLGEIGEKRVQKFLDRAGWSDFLHNFDIPCVRGDKHRTEKGNPRTKHCEDIFWAGQNPFYSEQLDVVHIQVKNPEQYYSINTGIRKVKEWVADLSNTIDCASKARDIITYISNTRNVHKSCKKVVDHGVLFYLSNSTDETTKDIRSSLLNMEYPHSSKTRPVIIIDNARLYFLNKVLDFLDRSQSELFSTRYYYYVPHQEETLTDLGLMDISAMPLSYMSGGLVAVKAKNSSDNKQGLYLFCPEAYSEDTASMCASLGFSLLRRWGSYLRLVFPNYEEGKDGTINAQAKLKHEFSSLSTDFELSILSL